MKTLFTTLALVFCLNANAQTQTLICQADSSYLYNSGTQLSGYLRDRSYYTYNANGQGTSTLTQTRNQGAASTWSNVSQSSYTYHANGQIANSSLQNWNINNGLLYFQVTYTLNTSGQETNYLYLYSDPNTGSLSIGIQRSSTYNANGLLIHQTSLTWNIGTSTWDNGSQIFYTYNANGQRTNILSQAWNASTSTWSNISQTSYTYNANGQVANEIIQVWSISTGTLQSGSQKSYTYNANGQKASVITQTWNTSVSTWNNVWQTSYTYNMNGQLTNELFQIWDVGTLAWVNNYQELHTYNASGQKTNYIKQNWNASTSTWVSSSQQLFTYNANGQQVSVTNQTLNTSTSTWVNQTRTLFTYNTNGQLTNELYQGWASWQAWGINGERIYYYAYPNISVTSATICTGSSVTLVPSGAGTNGTYTISGGNFIVSPNTTTSYSVTGTNNLGCISLNTAVATVSVSECTGIRELNNESFGLSVYPNPVSEILNLELGMMNGNVDISVTDVLGKQIRNEKVKIENGAAQINVSELPKAIYFIKIGNTTGKFVKE